MRGGCGVVLVLLVLCAVNAKDTATKQKKHGQSDSVFLHETANANNVFSQSLYKSVCTNSTEESFVMSPFSLHSALGLTYFGAQGRTADQMAAGLKLTSNRDGIKTGFRLLFTSLKSSGSMNLQVASRMYIQNGFSVLKDFRKVARKSFGSDTKEVDFVHNWEKAGRTINKWVDKKTGHKITEIVGPGVVNEMTRLVLVNAVYFNAQWSRPFNSEDTQIGKFHISRNQQVDVPMMHMKTFLGYKHLVPLGVRILELPYEGDAASMFILLPDDLEGIKNLESGENFAVVTSNFTDVKLEEINVSLPKFKVETSLDLKSNLMKLGMIDMFQADSADFSGITGSRDLYVSNVLQKAFVDITELGTEAGASTAITAEARSWRPPPLQFVVDHPFLFIIWQKRLNTTLFMGRFLGPQ